MITKQQIVEGLANKTMTVELSTWGDGMRGVGIYRLGERRPIERLAIDAWHVDQNDGIQYADENTDDWSQVFDSFYLSTQARKYLCDLLRDQDAAIEAYCSGDETARLTI